MTTSADANPQWKPDGRVLQDQRYTAPVRYIEPSGIGGTRIDMGIVATLLRGATAQANDDDR